MISINYVADDINLVPVLKQGVEYSNIYFIICIKLEISIMSHFLLATNQATSNRGLVLSTYHYMYG